MGNKSGKIIEEADYTDNLFIGCDGKFMQWSISKKIVTKNYGGIMAGEISSMVQISDKNYLFLADDKGC
jgi:hypothetical protein